MRDPNSWIQASAETLAETLSSKNHDYAPEGEFSNFEKAAEIAGTNAMIVMAAQAAIKMTRIQSLMDPRAGTYENESLKDSFLDLAGYALIAHAYLSAIDSGVMAEDELAGEHPSKEDCRINGHQFRFGGGLCLWCDTPEPKLVRDEKG